MQSDGGRPTTIQYWNGIRIAMKEMYTFQIFESVSRFKVNRPHNHTAYKSAYKSIRNPMRLTVIIRHT